MARPKIKSATDQRPFIMVYHDFLDSDVIGSHEKMVFIALKKFADSKNQCFPSLKKLSDVTGLSKRKIQDTLKELEQKHIITIESRLRADGGTTSNLYTLYDFKELWNAGSSEEMAAVVDEYEDKKLISLLEAKGYTVIKTKELETEPTKAQNQALKYNNDMLNTTIIPSESQAEESWIKECIEEERWSEEDIKQHYEYDILISRHQDIEDIDGYIELLYDLLNEKGEYITISGDKKPVKKVWEKLEKLNYEHILYCIEQMSKQTTRINNAKEYKKKLLYEAYYQMHDDIKNQVQHDMANWEPQTE